MPWANRRSSSEEMPLNLALKEREQEGNSTLGGQQGPRQSLPRPRDGSQRCQPHGRGRVGEMRRRKRRSHSLCPACGADTWFDFTHMRPTVGGTSACTEVSRSAVSQSPHPCLGRTTSWLKRSCRLLGVRALRGDHTRPGP